MDVAVWNLVFQELDDGVSGGFYYFEPLGKNIGDFLPNKAHPSDVGIDGFWVIHLGPHIDQDQIALTDFTKGFFGRRVMRIGSVWSNRDKRRFVKDHPFFMETIGDELLDFIFGGLSVLLDELLDLLKSLVFDLQRQFASLLLQLIGPFGINRGDALENVAAASNLQAEGLDVIDGAPIRQRDAWEQTVLGDVHQNRFVAA